MSLFEEYFPARNDRLDEWAREWERLNASKPFDDLVRELGTPYERLPNGVLYRDRRSFHPGPNDLQD